MRANWKVVAAALLAALAGSGCAVLLLLPFQLAAHYAWHNRGVAAKAGAVAHAEWTFSDPVSRVRKAARVALAGLAGHGLATTVERGARLVAEFSDGDNVWIDVELVKAGSLITIRVWRGRGSAGNRARARARAKALMNGVLRRLHPP